MCQMRLCTPAWVSCHVNTIRDTLTAFMDVKAVITLMDMMTDLSPLVVGVGVGGREAGEGRCRRPFAARSGESHAGTELLPPLLLVAPASVFLASSSIETLPLPSSPAPLPRCLPSLAHEPLPDKTLFFLSLSLKHAYLQRCAQNVP